MEYEWQNVVNKKKHLYDGARVRVLFPNKDILSDASKGSRLKKVLVSRTINGDEIIGRLPDLFHWKEGTVSGSAISYKDGGSIMIDDVHRRMIQVWKKKKRSWKLQWIPR